MVRKGGVSACAWMDRKVVMAMFSNAQPSATSSVLRRQKDHTRTPVTCPESILLYNKYMGGVDRGDQLRGYYSCRTKSRKFDKYVSTFYTTWQSHVRVHSAEELLPRESLQETERVPTAAGTRDYWRLLKSSTSWSQANSHHHSASKALPSEQWRS